MNKLKNTKKTTSADFEILRSIKNQPDLTQRDIAKSLKLSLGKVNYCIKSLKDKGLILKDLKCELYSLKVSFL